MKQDEFVRILQELSGGRIAYLTIGDSDEVFRRAFVPDERLILLGGGHVSLALAKIAVTIGFSVTVVDDRLSFANSDRFPMAARVICDSFAHAIRDLRITAGDYVCVLTRGHRWDTVCVHEILSGGDMPYYFGMIGSRRRVSGMRELLLSDGYDPARIERLHAPIGLKIGGVTPEEIAISIAAELIQCRHEKPATLADGILSQTNTDQKMLEYLASGGEPRAMLAVLDADGSTPVRGGAMMAVNAMGQGYGTVGGGCGEAAAITQARRIIGTGGRKILELDMTDEVAADHGMVCGGTMRILIEDITD